jgi:hypothetical protein
MNWEAPAALEIKMDAEISSYQDDTNPREEPVVRIEPAERVPMPVHTSEQI